MTQKVRKAVLPVAGWGTRFLPATKAMPKEMLPLVDKPLIQYAIEEAKEAGIEEFILVTGGGKQAIENHFDQSPELEMALEAAGKNKYLDIVRSVTPADGKIIYTRQKERRGLGHAIGCAQSAIGNEPFAVLLPDDVIVSNPGRNTLGQMIDKFEKTGKSSVLAIEVPEKMTSRYGILDFDPSQPKDMLEVKGFVEKPADGTAPSNCAILGRYVFPAEIFDYIDKTKPGAKGEIQITDAMHAIAQDQGFIGHILDGKYMDCGDKLGFLQATVEMALMRDEFGDDLRKFLTDLMCTQKAA